MTQAVETRKENCPACGFWDVPAYTTENGVAHFACPKCGKAWGSRG